MDTIYESKYADVYYVSNKNVVLVVWKSYCELDEYRKPLLLALDVIKNNQNCNYCADTRNGFMDNPLDTVRRKYLKILNQYTVYFYHQ